MHTREPKWMKITTTKYVIIVATNVGQISPDEALLKTISQNGVVLKEFFQGDCFLRGLHELQSKPPLTMASSLRNAHVAGKPPLVLAS